MIQNNLSSFSSDPQIDYRSNRRNFGNQDFDETGNEMNIQNIQDVFLPFYSSDNRNNNIDEPDRSNGGSTVFKSEGVSNLISPITKNARLPNANKDLNHHISKFTFNKYLNFNRLSPFSREYRVQ